MKLSFCILTAGWLLLPWSAHAAEPATPLPPLKELIDRFAPCSLTADISRLSPGDRAALAKLIEAAKLMNRLYLRQSWEGMAALHERLEQDASETGRQRLRLFQIEMGPWSSLDHDAPFVPGVPPRPPQADYYPKDMTRSEFETWAAGLTEDERAKVTGFFWTIRREANGGLQAIPYSREYRDVLQPASELLRQAASLTDNASLRNYLEKRANAFLSNDYYDSDVAWMELDSPLDITIGPYETYMDELFNYKAAFEAFISVRNEAESRKLQEFSAYLQEIEDHLPIDAKYRNPSLGKASPIRVVDEVFVGGEAAAGVQTAAFNLPNDERVIREKGSKRVMLKNVQEAKFQRVLKPIAASAVHQSQQPLIAFEPFFTHILAHELMHGLGPHDIVVEGKKTTVRHSLKELYSAVEEAKADISGLFALQYLIDRGVVAKETEKSMYATFLAGVFRSVRFGINEAHGKGMAVQFNYLLDQGAFTFETGSESFQVDFDKVKEATRKLTGEIMTLQAEGSYSRAKELLETYGIVRPQMKRVLEKLKAIPVDIAPSFPLAQQSAR